MSGKRETTTTTATSRENKISKLGWPVLIVEIGLTDAKTTRKSQSGAPKTSKIWPQNPPKAIFGSKRRANEAQESSKTNLEVSLVDLEAPKGSQESPKTIAKPFLYRKR